MQNKKQNKVIIRFNIASNFSC